MIAIPNLFISPCMTSIFPLCILRTFQVPNFNFFLQLRLSLCSLIRSVTRLPFGFSPVTSLDQDAFDAPSRSFPVAVETHSGLGVSPSATISFKISFFMTVFLAKLTGVVCHCLPLVLPAVPVRSLFHEGKGTNSLHHSKVGTEDFGSSAQVGSETPIRGYVVQHSSLCYSDKPEWLTNLCKIPSL